MTRKKVTLEIKGEDISLEELSFEEKEKLLSLVKGDPQLINFYLLRELMRIRKRLGSEQWVQKYEYNLDTAETNELIDTFPTLGSKYVYIHSCSGVVQAHLDSRNEPVWTLAARDQFRLPFERIHLSWAAQATKKLIFYVSNKEILRTTLA